MATSSASERDLAPGVSRGERRRHPRARFSVRRPVSISLDRKATAVVLDLSQAGVGIRSLGPIRRGRACRLQFHLPDTRERIEAEAVATWSDDACRTGFEFTTISAPTRALLAEWVEHRSYSGPSPFSRPATANSGRGTEIIALERELGTLDQESALRLLVARSQALTEAEGTAIALGGSEGMICRASLGNAPDLGVCIQPNSGLSGECLRTGVVVRCENTELDPRVDREVCRTLNLRSAVVVPVIVDTYSVAGLLEVFSSRAHAFSGRHVLLLRQIAELISKVLSSTGKPAPSGPPAENFTAEAEVAPAAASAVRAVSTAVARPDSRIICDVCGFENLPIDRDCQKCDVPLPAALEDPASFMLAMPSVPEAKEVIRPVRTPEPTSRGLSRLLLWFLVGVVLAVSAVAGVRWWYGQQPRPAPGSVELSPLLSSAVEASERQTPGPLLSMPARAADVTELAAKPKPSPKASREPEVVLKNTKLPESSPSAATPSAPEVSRIISGSKLDSPLVAVLSAPAATPRWVIASSSPVPAKLRRKVDPVYPTAAVARRIEGKVLLHAIVSHKGIVQAVTVLQGNDLLAQAAVHAVKQWQYSPAQVDGQSVDAEANITIRFSLSH